MTDTTTGLLAGRLALVSGATGDIGGAVVRGLVGSGARVYLTGRRGRRLQTLSRGLGESCLGSEAVDFADPAGVEAFARRLRRRRDVFDILVHCAGTHAASQAADLRRGEIERLFRVNCEAAMLLTRGLLPALTAPGGDIVFVNSSIVARPAGGESAYAASKQALQSYAAALRSEVNPLGIRVLSVYPGRTASAMQRSVVTGKGRAYDPQRLLQPEDIAAVIVHALSMPGRAEITDIWLRPAAKTS